MQTIFFAFIALIGGLAFFMFGMKFMSQSLEKMTGGLLEKLLRKLTSNPIISLGLGIIITVAMQSSSATTVMLVGLVNSGIMELGQTISIIFGSNIGTTITSWILSLSSISSTNIFMQMLKPINFSPVVAFIGILLVMFAKKDKNQSIGNVLLGFSLLMYGMTIMSESISPLAQYPEFNQILVKYNNPILLVMVGLIVTAVIQSSAASIGILQALSMSMSIPFNCAIPIIMGQNIGTCATSLISCIGTNKNAKRVATLHISIKIIGTIICLSVYVLLDSIFKFSISSMSVNPFTIALVHTLFNIAITLLLAPFSKLLIKLVQYIIKDNKKQIEEENKPKTIKEKAHEIAKGIVPEIDDRLFRQPSMALSECNNASRKMAQIAKQTLELASLSLIEYDEALCEKVMINEEIIDRFEDALGTYLVRLSSQALSENDTCKISRMLHTIGDFERLGDHAVSLIYTAKEMNMKKLSFSKQAKKELEVLRSAVQEVVSLTTSAYIHNDSELAKKVEPLEQVIDKLIVEIKDNHVNRLQLGHCSIQMGFVLSDTLTSYKRISDHCSNIAVAIIKLASDTKYDTHKYLNYIKQNDETFTKDFERYLEVYDLAK